MLLRGFCFLLILQIIKADQPEEKCPRRDYDHLEILERTNFDTKQYDNTKAPAPISVSNAQVLVRFEDLIKPQIQPTKVPYILVPFTGKIPRFSDFYLPLSKAASASKEPAKTDVSEKVEEDVKIVKSPPPPARLDDDVNVNLIKPEPINIKVSPLSTKPNYYLVDEHTPVLKDTLDEDYITRITKINHPHILPKVVLNVSSLLEDSLVPVICSTCQAAPKILVSYPIVRQDGVPLNLPPISIANCGCTRRVLDEDRLFGFNGKPINLCTCQFCQNPRRVPAKFVHDVDELEVYRPPQTSFKQFSSSSSMEYLEDPQKILIINRPKSYNYVSGNYPEGKVIQSSYKAPEVVTLVDKPTSTAQNCKAYQVIPKYDIVPRYDIKPVPICKCGPNCRCKNCAKYTRELDFY